MLKAVFKSNELIPLTDKIVIDSPTSFPEIAHLATIEDDVQDIEDVDEYKGPTADDLRREAELFKSQWEDEKEKMISSAKAEAETIVQEAREAGFAEAKKQTDEAQVIKQQAEEEAQRILTEANNKALEQEKEVRQSLDAERNEAKENGRVEGREDGYAEGKAEVERLIGRTQTVLERAQNKRSEILSETEKEIVNLVLLIARKVIKVISENQRDIIITNVVEALRKVKTKGNIVIRVNLADLKLATEHKQEFINVMEGVNSINVVEDSSVDSGGCIIETDFGEIDARIASQLAELENKILEISPIKSNIKGNIPVPVVRTASLNTELAASALMNAAVTRAEAADAESEESSEEEEISAGANAALTASAALAALATMATKGKRDSDKKIAAKMEGLIKRKSD
jgi:flagellar assembly protein FliH